mgnify:FL=1
MQEEIKKQLDQIGDLVDAKIEKAAGQIKDNAKGEMDEVLKSEISNLTNQYLETTKRIDEMEVANKKQFSNKPMSFKGSLQQAFADGAIDSLQKGNASRTAFEVKADDMVMTSPGTGQVAAYSGVVAAETIVPQFKFDPSRKVHVREFLPVGTTDAQTIRFPKESGYEDNSAATAQGAALTKSDFEITATSVNVEKIGTFMTLTDEMLQDTPQLTSYLSARVPEKVLSEEDDQILNGNGTAPNLSGLFTDGAVFSDTAAGIGTVTSANEYDVLVVALAQLAASNYQATAIMLNPADMHKIALLKSSQNEYLRQQLYSGLQPQIMGVNIIQNTAVTAGNFILGDFNQATQLWVRENLSIEFAREHASNFTSNMVTVRVQERVALTNYQPNAIVRGVFSTAITALGA